METELGIKNLTSFVNSGYDHIHVTPNSEAMRKLNKLFNEMISLLWLVNSNNSAVLRVAVQFNIPLVFYSEDGEVEYGGDAKYKNDGLYGVDYMISRYLEAGYEKVLKKANLSELENIGSNA